MPLFFSNTKKAASTLTCGLLTLATATDALAYTPDPALYEKALEIQEKILTLDTHLDVPIVMMRPGFSLADRHSVEEDFSQIDFPRMKEGRLDGGFFSVYVGQGPRNPEANKGAQEKGMALVDMIHAAAEELSDQCEIAYTVEDAYRIDEAGKNVIFMGIENGWIIGRDLDMLEAYYDKGVRYFGIAHTRNNDLGDSSTDANGMEWDGLSNLGKAAVKECNRLGIMVDISHIHDKTVWDVLETTKTPVVASHSGSYAEYPHPRNINDALLKAVKKNGGVIQMNLFSAYMMDMPPNPERNKAFRAWFQKYRSGKELTAEEQAQSLVERRAIVEKYPRPAATVEDAVDHIDHMVKIMGIDHVGISGDYDGGGGVTGANHVGELPNITAEMLKRGYTEEDLEKFWGGNVMRVLKACEDYAASLKAES
ncbi:MAG: dipeptidase [Opitutales bacterium]